MRHLALLLSIALTACTATPPDSAPDTAADTGLGGDTSADTDTDTGVEEVLTGAELYEAHCASCHGDDGRGVRNKGPDLTGEIGRMSDAQIIEIILNGKGRNEMPAIDVTEEEAQRIVDFMRESF